MGRGRDMARVRMVLESGAAVGADGNINAKSLANALGKVYSSGVSQGSGRQPAGD